MEENYYSLFLFSGNVRWNALDMYTFSNDELCWRCRASPCLRFSANRAQMAYLRTNVRFLLNDSAWAMSVEPQYSISMNVFTLFLTRISMSGHEFKISTARFETHSVQPIDSNHLFWFPSFVWNGVANTESPFILLLGGSAVWFHQNSQSCQINWQCHCWSELIPFDAISQMAQTNQRMNEI